MILTWNYALFRGVDDVVESGRAVCGFNVVIIPDSFYQTSPARNSPETVYFRPRTYKLRTTFFNYKTVGQMPTYHAVVRLTL